MELVLFLVFVLVRVRLTLQQQQQTSSEDINNILEKLIAQVNNSNTDDHGDTSSILAPYFPVNAEGEAGNDSNIYVFKTYMAPQIKYRNYDETQSVFERSNKNIKQLEDLSEDELITGTLKEGFFEVEERVQEGSYSDEKESDDVQLKSGDIAKNLNILKSLLKKEINLRPTNEPLSYADLQKPLSLLHNYPEVVIDHIRYNKQEKDYTFLPNLKNNGILPQGGGLDLYRNIPKNIFTLNSEVPATPQYTPANSQSFTSDLKDLVGTLRHNKVAKDTIVNKLTENETKKQSILLEKILQKLPDKAHENIANVDESRTEIRNTAGFNNLPSNDLEKITLLSNYLQLLNRNLISRSSTTFLRDRALAQNWLSHRHRLLPPYSSRTLLSRSTPEGLKRTRLLDLFHRVLSRHLFRSTAPGYYGLY